MMPRFLFLALLLAVPSTARPADPAVAQEYTDFLSGVLGIPFSTAERNQMRAHLDAYWQANNRQVMRNVDQAIQGHRLLQQQEPGLRAAVQKMTRPDILRGYHQAAAAGEAEARYVLDLYYRHNPVLASAQPGGLPLTRDMIEGWLGVKHWTATVIHRQPAPAPDANTIERAARQAAQEYPQLSAQQQLKFAQMPGENARLRWAWQRATPIDQLLTRAELGGRLTPQEQAQVQQVMAQFQGQLNGMAAQHQNAMLGGAIRGFQESTDIIMGRGTVFNPTTNRWEQQGGIVTEYNGVVRVP